MDKTKRRLITLSQKNDILEASIKGKSRNQLSKQFMLSKDTIRNILRKNFSAICLYKH
jgi:Mor family transcriptional regulator